MPVAYDIRELSDDDDYMYEVRIKHGDGTTEVLAEGKGVFASLMGSEDGSTSGKQVINFGSDDLTPQVIMSSIIALHDHLDFIMRFISHGMEAINFDSDRDDWSKIVDLAVVSLMAYTDLKCPGQKPVSQMEKGDLN